MSEPMKKRHISEDIEEYEDWRDIFREQIEKHTSQGLYLRGIRLREGYSQKKLGTLIGVNQNNISAMENGKRSIGKEIAKRLAEILHTDYRLFL